MRFTRTKEDREGWQWPSAAEIARLVVALLVAGLLQILLPLGIGRMYMGDVGLGVAQLVVTLVTCGIGALWPFIDGIIILVGDPVDSDGRPLRS